MGELLAKKSGKAIKLTEILDILFCLSALEPEKYAHSFLKRISELYGIRSASIKIVLDPFDELKLLAYVGLPGEYEVWESRGPESRINMEVFLKGKSFFVEDVGRDEDFKVYRDFYEKEKLVSFFSAPIAGLDRTIGVFNVYNFSDVRVLDELKEIFGFFGKVFQPLWLSYVAAEKNRNLIGKMEELRNVLRFYELTMENLPIGVIATDNRGRVVFMNRALESMSKQDRKNALGRKWYKVFGFSGEVRQKLETTFWTGETKLYPEIYLPLKDGDLVPLEMKTSLIEDGKGNKLGVVAICTDLSEKKRLERSMEKLERLSAVGQLASSVAHEIRNPLAGIKAALQVLGDRISLDGRLEKLFETVLVEVNRLDKVVSNLLSFSSSQKLSFKRIDIKSLLEEVTLLVGKLFSQKGIKVVKNWRTSNMKVIGDRNALKQVFINLLLNAQKATKKGGTVTISVTGCDNVSFDGVYWDREGGEVKFPERCITVIVEDNGSGIPKDVMPRIFEPFYSTTEGSSGLGLYISSKIIEKHGGVIGVYSEVGRGSKFFVIIPYGGNIG